MNDTTNVTAYCLNVTKKLEILRSGCHLTYKTTCTYHNKDNTGTSLINTFQLHKLITNSIGMLTMTQCR